jgi:hypothetical protein
MAAPQPFLTFHVDNFEKHWSVFCGHLGLSDIFTWLVWGYELVEKILQRWHAFSLYHIRVSWSNALLLVILTIIILFQCCLPGFSITKLWFLSYYIVFVSSEQLNLAHTGKQEHSTSPSGRGVKEFEMCLKTAIVI